MPAIGPNKFNGHPNKPFLFARRLVHLLFSSSKYGALLRRPVIGTSIFTTGLHTGVSIQYTTKPITIRYRRVEPHSQAGIGQSHKLPQSKSYALPFHGETDCQGRQSF